MERQRDKDALKTTTTCYPKQFMSSKLAFTQTSYDYLTMIFWLRSNLTLNSKSKLKKVYPNVMERRRNQRVTTPSYQYSFKHKLLMVAMRSKACHQSLSSLGKNSHIYKFLCDKFSTCHNTFEKSPHFWMGPLKCSCARARDEKDSFLKTQIREDVWLQIS